MIEQTDFGTFGIYRNYYKNARVLVIGAETFIGNTLVKALHQAGAEVYATVYPQNAWKLRSPFFRSVIRPEEAPIRKNMVDFYTAPSVYCANVYPLDVNNFDEMQEIMTLVQPHYVFHLAAITQVLDAARIAKRMFQTNIMGTVNVLEAVRGMPNYQSIRTLVASSDKAYGVNSWKVDETMAFRPQHPYDASKAAVAHICHAYGHQYGMRIGISHSSNVYGPGDVNRHRIIPEAFLQWLNGNVLELRSDAETYRQYLFVTDAVHGYMAMGALGLPENQEPMSNDFNFGSEEATSLLELVRTMAEVFEEKMRDKRPEYRSYYKFLDNSEKTNNEIVRQFVKTRKAREFLNWEPRTSLLEGLFVSLQWYIQWNKAMKGIKP